MRHPVYVSLAALVAAPFATAQTITDVGAVTPYAVSGNGQRACGLMGDTAFKWAESTGVLPLPPLAGHAACNAIAASADGSFYAGYSSITTSHAPAAVRWSSFGPLDLGSLSPSSTYANDISADGSIVIGRSGELPFRWTQATGMQSLGLSGGWTSATPTSISTTGAFITGFASTASGPMLFRWTASGFETLTPLVGNAVSAAGISDDGQTIAGRSGSGLYRWTQAGGLQNLGVLPGYSTMTVTDMSADGSVIVGYAATGFPSFSNDSFIWTQATGLVTLSSYLTAQGVNLSGWSLQFAFGVSADGQTFVGLGTNAGPERGWIVHLSGGTTCYPNCDGSTQAPVLNVQDFTCFLQRYAAGDSYANCDQSTVTPTLNVQDFTCFLQQYAAGCR
jgi:uncharacterized membrane protein